MSKESQREHRKQAYRDKIIQAAMALFEAKGLEETKLSDICQQAGISRPTFYSYYASKQVLIQALGEQIWLNVTGDFADQSMVKEQSPQDFVRAFFQIALQEITEFSRLERELIQRSMGQDSENRMSVLKELTQMFADVYERGYKNKQITNKYPVAFLAEMTMGSINAVMMNWATDEEYPIGERIKQLSTYIPSVLNGES